MEKQHHYPPKNTTRQKTEEEQHHFTLITPNQLTSQDEHQDPYNSFSSTDITSTLQRLVDFWNNNLQEHDLGLQHNNITTTTTTTKQQQQTTQEEEEEDITELRQRPLSPVHKLLFKHDGRLFLIKELSTPTPTTSTRPARGDGDTPQTSAWWLDITCPTSSDMHQLCKIFPLHPLTIEDILHQDTREKTETFHGLGYYLVCFRGLDPSNFNYQEEEEEELIHPTTSPKSTIHNNNEINKRKNLNNNGIASTTSKKKKLNLIPILQNQLINPKKPVDETCGVRAGPEHHPQELPATTTNTPATHSNQSNSSNRPGLGVVNMYLIVFRDGIISFHFGNVQKHIHRVKDRIQSFSSDTDCIAYGLMDSIVDEFFPVLELIEEETDELEEYLLDPIGSTTWGRRSCKARKSSWKKEEKTRTKNKKKKQETRIKLKERIKPKTMMNKNYNYKLKSLSMIDRSEMLNRITFNRRLVVSMARLIAQKFQTVHALRKRMIDHHHDHSNLGEPFSDHQSREIGLYLSDLQDHILTLTQALTFYDTILSNAHSTYLGVLRVGLNVTKQEQDVMIIRLYLITLIVLPMNMLIGLHSMNIHIPANGDQVTHLRADGSSAPYTVFAIVLSACFLIGSVFILFIWKVIINHSQIMFNRLFPKLFYFI